MPSANVGYNNKCKTVALRRFRGPIDITLTRIN
jgi:hypothetical protein